ncbi:helix-turn-helix transcriptional regulator [Fredinandcohnia humi]
MRYLNLKFSNTKIMMSHFNPNSADPVEHDHGNDYQITIPLKGKTYLEQNKITSQIDKHFLTSPGEKHFHFTDSEEGRILLININRFFLDHVVSEKVNEEIYEVHLLNQSIGSPEKIIKIADEMIKCNLFDNENKIRNEELEWELVESFLSIQNGSHFEIWQRDFMINSHPVVKKVIQYIQKNFENELSLDDLADQSHMSKFYLIKLFKDIVGCTPSQYLLKIRVEHAVDLLLHTNWDITKICFDSGFGSLNTFERVFKKRYGMTISEFRRTNKI